MSVSVGDGDPAPVDHRKGPRRRGEALFQAIFEATLAELAEVGYARFTMEKVAAQARTSKASLYRRWPNRAALVVDAVAGVRPTIREPPDSGDVRADLIAFFTGAVALFDGPYGEAVRGLICESLEDPGRTELVRSRMFEFRSRMVLDILRRGAERGQVRPGALTTRIADVGPQLIAQHFLVHGAPVPDEVVTEIVDEVVIPLISP
ncbi:TetR/AcrR family transcriptional regulator [Spirillospora sp. NBC_00431]